MSRPAVTDFLRQIASDETLQRELIDLAAKHGFTITTDDLTDAQLDSVTGGTLSVGSADDKHEREADAEADRIVGSTAPRVTPDEP